MHTPVLFWIIFNVGVLGLLYIDLFFHKEGDAISIKEASLWSAFWFFLSVCFGGVVWWWKGPSKGIEFFTGYTIEYALSVDNLFLFLLIFSYFKVSKKSQHHVLFWGILGAFVFRGIMIGLGAYFVTRYHWILYIFGAFLLVTGFKMLWENDDEMNLENNQFLLLCRKHLPITANYVGKHFYTRQAGRFFLTPLALVLIVVEGTDLVFALDSIPAVFAITQDAFIIYTSNICAILGLRSLYFLLAGALVKFAYLQKGLGIILAFIGCKMVSETWLHISTGQSLLVIVTILACSIVLSMIKNKQSTHR